MTRRGSSPLNGSIIPLSVTPEWFYQESKLFKGEDIWIPDKRFRNDKKRGIIPECIYQESKLFKDKIQA